MNLPEEKLISTHESLDVLKAVPARFYIRRRKWDFCLDTLHVRRYRTNLPFNRPQNCRAMIVLIEPILSRPTIADAGDDETQLLRARSFEAGEDRTDRFGSDT
jgi:hypothetical protein